MIVKCDIFRADPRHEDGGSFDRFEIEAEENDTVLDVLVQIYHEKDPSLAFRYACGVARCGECAVLVNNVPCMACDKMAEPEMKIEPLGNVPVIKDLAVDRRFVFNQIHRMLPQAKNIENVGEKLHALSPEEAHRKIERSIRLTNCFECMICQSACPRYISEEDRFPGPLGLLMLTQMTENPIQEKVEDKKIEKLTAYCLHCGKCANACPALSKPLRLSLDILDCSPSRYVRLNIDANGVMQMKKQNMTVEE